jgi:hypothetical protein
MGLAILLMCAYTGLLCYVLFDIRKNVTKKRALLGKIIPLLFSLCAVVFLTFYTESFHLPNEVVQIIAGADVIMLLLLIGLSLVLFATDIYKREFLFFKYFFIFLGISLIPAVLLIGGYNIILKVYKF